MHLGFTHSSHTLDIPSVQALLPLQACWLPMGCPPMPFWLPRPAWPQCRGRAAAPYCRSWPAALNGKRPRERQMYHCAYGRMVHRANGGRQTVQPNTTPWPGSTVPTTRSHCSSILILCLPTLQATNEDGRAVGPPTHTYLRTGYPEFPPHPTSPPSLLI